MSIIKAEREVEFIDIDDFTQSMKADALEKRVADTRKKPVAGVIFIRSYGAIYRDAPDFSRLKALSPTTLIVDDRCAAFPEIDQASLIETGADVYLYSTGYGKVVDLGAGGFAHVGEGVNYTYDQAYDAGFVLSDYQVLDELCKSLLRDKNHKRLDLSLVKSSSWLDTSPLAITWSEYGDAILAKGQKVSTHKALADQIYYETIPKRVFLGNQFNGWRHQILVDQKDVLLKTIFENHLFASGHYNTVAKLFRSGNFPNSDHLYSRIVNLFNDLYIDEKQMLAVAQLVRAHVSCQ
jgi:hypothetical protein